MSTDRKVTLVLGGTGKTGRRVARRLEAAGVPVRIGSRAGQPRFDWDDPATWNAALRDVDRAYLVFSPDLAVAGAAERMGEFADQAARVGVKRLVLLSGRGEAGAERGERLVRACGADCTIVRASWFNQNFSESFFLEPLLEGALALPAGAVAEPFVDADDLADVVVAALTGEGHAGELYEVTGPRLLTFADAVAEIAAASGREISYVPCSVAEYAAALRAEGLPGEVVDLVTYLFQEVLDGRNARLADGVQRALGRPPRDFRDYARATAATGVWSAPSLSSPALRRSS